MGSGFGRLLCWITAVIAAGCTKQVQPGPGRDAIVGSASSGLPTAYARAFPEQDSRAACEKAIEARTAYRPSRLDVHRFSGYATEIDGSGNRTVIQEFTAKNSVGSEIAYRALCIVQPDGHLEINMAETTAR